MMKYIKLIGFSLLTFIITFAAAESYWARNAHAAETLEVSGWIPYWTVKDGTRDARRQLNVLDEINPFTYAVQPDGSIKDLGGMDQRDWKRLISDARRRDVRVVPSFMWSDGAAIHAILSDPARRAAHIKNIVSIVKRERYDGADIDYEAKKAETKDHFSAFTKELKAALGDKHLSCTIEARTPPESLYAKIPATLRYANDFTALGTHCDRVKIMAYDQRNADIRLNAAKSTLPYMPVADVDWVRKTAQLALQLIPKDKLVLGIPTYGHEYEVNISPAGAKTYRRIGSINPGPAKDKARQFRVTPLRQLSGEIGYLYASSSALRYVTWSDAGAVKQKVDLARELGLRGVAIFKIDGGEDRKIWNLF